MTPPPGIAPNQPNPEKTDKKTTTRSFTMTLTAILNAILAVGVIVIVVTPLVWAILTQHRHLPGLAATDSATGPAAQVSERLRAARGHCQPAAGGA
jgi:hypothetical protein